MTRWEYKVLTMDVGGFFKSRADFSKAVRVLDDVGADGWELVSSFDTNVVEGMTDQIIFVLKRPVAT